MANILVVEDNDLSYELASELLGAAGHKTTWARDAEGLYREMGRQRPDLILMDIGLPIIDGLSLTRRLKADACTQQIPIVAFTAMVMQKDRENAQKAGCDGFIPKPIDVPAFVQTVENYIKTVPEYKPHSILAVDDNIMNAEILKEALESVNQSVELAFSGKQALKAMEQENFDLILLDIMMPDISGFDIMERIRTNPKTADIPVVFISALDNTESIVRGFSLGSCEYIVKPYKIAELKARILSILKINDLQAELKSEKKVLDSIFEFSADGIALLSPDFKVTSCNKTFEKWLDKDVNRIITPDFLKKTEEGLSRFYIEARVEETGQILGINCSRILSPPENTEGYVLVLRDITSDIEIEEQKETFVATITHDLKTPVRAQIRALQMLLDGKFGALLGPQEEILQDTLNSNRYMSYILDNLLATYKYENAGITLNREEIDLNILAKSCYKELKYLAEDKNLNITLDFREEQLKTDVDPVEIKRTFMNLLINAINYTDTNGKITIKTEKNANNAVISFSDDGRGMSEAEAAGLFKKFTSYANKFRQVGTGLGLYLSKHIIELHNGLINVESQEGKGSCFTVTLPLTGNSIYSF